MFDLLEPWSGAPPDVGALDGIVAAAVARVARALPGPFDVVASCSLLTQLQLVLLQVVGDVNPRFAELRTTLNRAHMRTLGALIAPAASRCWPPIDVEQDPPAAREPRRGHGCWPPDGRPDRRRPHHLRGAPGPAVVGDAARSALKQAFTLRYPIGPWIWRNGPDQALLVYGIEIKRT